MASKSSSSALPDDRRWRVCDICGKIDQSPRHRIAYAPGDAPPADQALIAAVFDSDLSSEIKAAAVQELTDTSIRSAHMDCCRDAGCFDGSCDEIHRSYDGEDKKDAELLDYLESGAVDSIGEQLNEQRMALH